MITEREWQALIANIEEVEAELKKQIGYKLDYRAAYNQTVEELHKLEGNKTMIAKIEELEAENEKLRKGLEIYERERIRFKHAKPEMTGEFFIAGYHGPKDDNVMPQFIEVCPAYGAGWVMIYEDSGRTISYEGS